MDVNVATGCPVALADEDEGLRLGAKRDGSIDKVGPSAAVVAGRNEGGGGPVARVLEGPVSTDGAPPTIVANSRSRA